GGNLDEFPGQLRIELDAGLDIGQELPSNLGDRKRVDRVLVAPDQSEKQVEGPRVAGQGDGELGGAGGGHQASSLPASSLSPAAKAAKFPEADWARPRTRPSRSSGLEKLMVSSPGAVIRAPSGKAEPGARSGGGAIRRGRAWGLTSSSASTTRALRVAWAW